MKTRYSKFKQGLLMAFLGLIIIIALLFWFTTNKPTIKMYALKKFPIPIVLVNFQPIFSSDFFDRLELIPLESQTQNVKQSLIKQLIYEKRQEIVLTNHKVKSLNPTQFLETNTNSQTSKLKLASLTKAKTDAYKFWFNSQKELNTEAYEQANYILSELNHGANFDVLAKQYSQDSYSKELNGDLGYIDSKNLLFELKDPLLEAEINQVVLLASRKGLHIIKIQNKKNETDKNMLYLKQIYVNTNSFADWINNQSKQIKVFYLFDNL